VIMERIHKGTKKVIEKRRYFSLARVGHTVDDMLRIGVIGISPSRAWGTLNHYTHRE